MNIPQLPEQRIDSAAGMLGELVNRDFPLARLTGYRVGGSAALFAVCKNISDLGVVSDAAAATGIEVVVVGRGSNLLISDKGFDGLVITLGGALTTWQIDHATGQVRAGGGAKLPTVVSATARLGLTGIEWAIGIPGSIGGALCMNAGIPGHDISRVLQDADIFDLRRRASEVWTLEECNMVFRGSAIASHQVVTSVTLLLEHGNREHCLQRQENYRRRRQQTQPGGRNTGSVFTNKDAWKLVRAAGADEMRVGQARVSSKHANFFVVDRRAVVGADDVFDLMLRVQRRVFEHSGDVLIPETRFLGFTKNEIAQFRLAD